MIDELETIWKHIKAIFITIFIILIDLIHWALVIMVFWGEDTNMIISTIYSAICYLGFEAVFILAKSNINSEGILNIQGQAIIKTHEVKKVGLKFKCQICGKDIIIRFLKIGEVARCRSCGSYNLVPDTSIRIDEENKEFDLRDLRNMGQGTWSKENIKEYIDNERNQWER